jgi:hypothetical protein
VLILGSPEVVFATIMRRIAARTAAFFCVHSSACNYLSANFSVAHKEQPAGCPSIAPILDQRTKRLLGPDEIEVMKSAYGAALIEVGVTDRDDPITDLIAKLIVNVTSTSERNPKEIMDSALNALGVRRPAASKAGDYDRAIANFNEADLRRANEYRCAKNGLTRISRR